MTLENPLMLGIILIAIGLATALLAVAILLNRRDLEKTGEEKTAEDDTIDVPIQEEIPVLETEPPPPEVPEKGRTSAEPEAAPAVESREQETGSSPELPAARPPADTHQPGPGAAADQIAAIKRHPETGRLIISISDREYSSFSVLRESSDWYIVSDSMNELKKWFQQEIPATQSLSSDLSLIEQPSPLQKSKGRKKKPEILPAPRSMVEQINDIIQEKIRVSGKTHLSVRLIESVRGEIKALIGVESYPLEEVPDPQIKEFIRECVADWERRV